MGDAVHRWSGWPGAWCLDCGADDANEICIATDGVILECLGGHCMCPDVEEHGGLKSCPEHHNEPCPEPGSNRHNPYSRNAPG